MKRQFEEDMRNNGKNLAPPKLARIERDMERALKGCRRIAREFNKRMAKDGKDVAISKTTTFRVMTDMGVYEKKPPRIHNHMARPSEPFTTFAMDFKEKVIAGGEKIHVLDMIDEFNNATVLLDAHRQANAESVVASLRPFAAIFAWKRNVVIRLDNGPEFQNNNFTLFCNDNGIMLKFVTKGCPWENAFMERHLRSVTEECLNLYWLNGVDDAQKVLTDYKHRYNRRENMGLGDKTPLQKMMEFHAAQRGTM